MRRSIPFRVTPCKAHFSRDRRFRWCSSRSSILISTSTSHARSANGTPVVITFDPHPLKVLRPQNAPHLLTATQHKIALIRDLGVEHLLVIPFDKNFAATPPENFIEQLVMDSNPLGEICVGHEWSFGKDRRGNLDLLKKLGAQFDFNVVAIPPVKVDGAVVSSTAVRRAVEQGDWRRPLRCSAVINHPRTVVAAVRLERSWVSYGQPERHIEQFPPTESISPNNPRWRGIPGVVISLRPTVSSGNKSVSWKLSPRFDRDIYGKMSSRFNSLLSRNKVDSLKRSSTDRTRCTQARELLRSKIAIPVWRCGITPPAKRGFRTEREAKAQGWQVVSVLPRRRKTSPSESR